MAIYKDTKSFGLPWKEQYGYSQVVKEDDTVYLSGQVHYDDNGRIVGQGDMEAQMRQAYANIRKLLEHDGAKMENLVEEVLFVTDMNKAVKYRKWIKVRDWGFHDC